VVARMCTADHSLALMIRCIRGERTDPDEELNVALGPPRAFTGYDAAQASRFAAAWLPAWTGDEPERLISFYTEDAFYSDPHLPNGITGRSALLAYFTRLLHHNPAWVWSQTASEPMKDGFVNHWRAEIPTGSQTVTVTGVCLVVLRDGFIARNEVFFDRTPLIPAFSTTRLGHIPPA
jgi:SnoaL-like domain